MDVGNEAEYAHEYAEAYGHGEVDDGETDAEEYADAEGYEALAADVVVHLALHIAYQFGPEGAVLLGEHLDEAGGQLLIVEEYEKEVEQGDERRHDADEHTGRLAYEREHLGHGVPYGLGHVFLLEEVEYAVLVLVDPLLYGYGEVGRT